MVNRIFGNLLSSWGKDFNGSVSQEVFTFDELGAFSIENVHRIFYETPLCAREYRRREVSNKRVLSGAIEKLKNCVDLSLPIAIVNHDTTNLIKSFRAPPVETSNLVNIVEYEVKEQIPFDIRDIEWRWLRASYQDLGQGLSKDEVVITAIKKDAVSRFLEQFSNAGLTKSPDLMQLEGLLLADYLWSFYPKFQNPDNKDAVVMLSMHSRSTRIIITNGNNLWQRDIPTGALSLIDVLSDIISEIKRTTEFYIGLNKEDSIIKQFMLLGGGLNDQRTKERVTELFSQYGFTPFEGESGNKIMEARINEDLNGNILAPTMAALQRLGLGKFKMNFLEGGKVYKPKSKEALGIDFGDHGITAVKVRVQ